MNPIDSIEAADLKKGLPRLSRRRHRARARAGQGDDGQGRDQGQAQGDRARARPGLRGRRDRPPRQRGPRHHDRAQGLLRPGVERIFPLHATTIDKIEVVKQARVRRAKLYYLRDRKGKAGRMKEKRDTPEPRPREGASASGRRLGRLTRRTAWRRTAPRPAAAASPSSTTGVELRCTSRFEDGGARGRATCCVAGVDEVGRGALCGPVVAGAVILGDGFDTDGPRRLASASRAGSASGWPSASGRGAQAWALGVGRAGGDRPLQHPARHPPRHAAGPRGPCASAPDFAARRRAHACPGVDVPQRAIVKGDALSVSIAAASIVAKVARDGIMRECDARYPGYGLARNMGYASEDHRDALRRLGPVGHPPALLRRENQALAILTRDRRLRIAWPRSTPSRSSRTPTRTRRPGARQGHRALQAARRRQPPRLEHDQEDRGPLRPAQQEHGGERGVREGRRLLRARTASS